MPRPLDEKQFQDEITAHLVARGYAYATDRDGQVAFDRATALIPSELLAFVRATQDQVLERVSEEALVEGWIRAIEHRGNIAVLHNGFDVQGQHVQPFARAPKDAGLEKTHQDYDANRLLVVDELHYDPNNENRLDLAVFLNGFPIFTVELKNQFTGQGARRALDQYRTDRDPTAPIFRFPYRTLVHFAVDKEHAWMTTRLTGTDTTFLPFNRGTPDGGRGNPGVEGDHPTSYLWKRIWERHTLLDIIERFVLHEPPRLTEKEAARLNDRQKLERGRVIFPRYHQHECVTLLEHRTLTDSPERRRYLAVHSTGSGKSLSMAWLAQRLTNLNHDGEKVFGTVIVVTDRVVLDEQMQALVPQVADDGAAHSIARVKDLEDALRKRRSIVITTIHKFFHLLQRAESLADIRGDVAVIIDEAHSSQGGVLQQSLERVLTRSTAGGIHLAYYAFTATPDDKAFDLFCWAPAGQKKKATHTYGMRQAREEGFIVDVLQNIVCYVQAAEVEIEGEDRPVPSTTRIASLVGDTDRLIAEKARVIAKHFHEEVSALLDRQAKAMVLANSIRAATKYAQTLRDEFADRGHGYPVYVAFSGRHPDSKLSESHYNDLATAPQDDDLTVSRRIASAFSTRGRVLVVVNKFQTGFNEPRLEAMYVDKPLSGRTAVQTLSRLNRTCGGLKTQEGGLPRVVDFVNDPTDLFKAFHEYDNGIQQGRILTVGYIEGLAEVLQPWINDERAAELARLTRDFRDGTADGSAISAFIKSVVEDYRKLDDRSQAAARAQTRAFAKHWPLASLALSGHYTRGTDHTRAHWRRHRLCELVSRWIDESSGPDGPERPMQVTAEDLKILDAWMLPRDHDGAIRPTVEDAPEQPEPYQVPRGRAQVVRQTLQALVDRYNSQCAAWVASASDDGVEESVVVDLLTEVHQRVVNEPGVQASAQHNSREVFARKFYLPEFREALLEVDPSSTPGVQLAVDWMYEHADVAGLRPAANAAFDELKKAG